MQHLRSYTFVIFLVAQAICLPFSTWAASTNIGSQAKVSPGINLTAVAPLSFGVLNVDTPNVAGFYEIEETDGSATSSNATQVGTFSRGEFTIAGRGAINVTLSMSASPLVCDITFLNPCVGLPSLVSLTNTFGAIGQISGASCTGVRCTDTVYIGGRLDFGGDEAGRWTADVTVTANYQ